MRVSLRARRRAGFTLVELMIALVIGALVVAATFSIGGASARHFQEQQRVGVTQRSVRLAMDRVRRDLARAGYMHVPAHDAPNVRACTAPAVPRIVPAVDFDDADSEGITALNTVNGTANNVSADRLRLIGNYSTGDSYLLRGLDGSGDTLFLQTDWLAFRRSFVVTSGATPVVDENRFENVVFRVGHMLHIETRSGFHFFVHITGSSINSTGVTAQIDISPAIPLDSACLEGLGGGATVTPLSWIEYAIVPVATTSSLAPAAPDITGPNTVLVRRELDMEVAAGTTVLPGTERVILEWAVDFNLDFVLDTNLAPGNPPELELLAGADAEGPIGTTPWQVRSAIVSLAARTPDQDERFPWPDDWGAARPVTAPLNRYQVFDDRPGAARVRTLTTEVQMPNLVL